ncbi:hypothetical protein L6452_08921 [Arctium lappa]|uniref:Uncharacterized protein n=1 Tax=Arctium lappa TaxID=4217 RepID=A0ACB9DJL6_ARCLA|nr:hypothetical protein L6452_08921 [Arctium lappa]
MEKEIRNHKETQRKGETKPKAAFYYFLLSTSLTLCCGCEEGHCLFELLMRKNLAVKLHCNTSSSLSSLSISSL